MAMSFVYQAIEIGQIPEQWIDIGVISYVVTEVCHRRRKDRRQPDGIDTQLRQIWQSMYNSPQVAYAVVIAILEGSRIDLINDPGLPPLRAFSFHRQILPYVFGLSGICSAPLNPTFR